MGASELEIAETQEGRASDLVTENSKTEIVEKIPFIAKNKGIFLSLYITQE